MRLRRETGDYSIKFAEGATSVNLPKGLGAEDFVGAIIGLPTEAGDTLAAVTAVVLTENGIVLGASQLSFTYNPTTGVLTKA